MGFFHLLVLQLRYLQNLFSCRLARVELHRPTLEDVFVQIVTGVGQRSEELRAALRAEPQTEGQGA